MDPVVRTIAVWLFLLVIFRLAGNRTMSEVTTFDFVLLLIVSEATQQALLGEDFSLTNAFLVILTLITLSLLADVFQFRSKRFQKITEGLPLVLVDDGELLRDRMNQARIDESDILHAGRSKHGLEDLSQVKYAVLERGGGISIVPR